MKKEDFYTLNFGQTIYHNGKVRRIDALFFYPEEVKQVVDFSGNHLRKEWEDICKDCSLDLSEKYKVYEDLKLVNNGKLLKGEFLAQLNNYLEHNHELRELIIDIIDKKVEV